VRSQSVVTYRFLIAGYVIFYAAALVVGLFFWDEYTNTVYEYRSSIHPGLLYSFRFWSILNAVYFLCWIIALIGMWFFWRPARFLLVATIVFGFAISYIMGLAPVVTSHPTSDLDSLSEICLGGLLALSFVGPVSEQFSATKNPKNVT
jgi:hypothetical protein